MNLLLSGQAYTSRSLAISAQSSINLYEEPLEDANERAKGRIAMYGCPGRHLFKDLTTIDAAATPVRGVWSGAGRLFVAAGTKYFEVSSAGALIGSVRTIADDASHTPVQFFPNGNQLFIVSAGVCYVDNGAGPNAISLPTLSGTVTTAGALVLWVSGDKFTPDMVGLTITINAVAYTVLFYLNPTALLLTTSAGAQVGVAYSISLGAMSAITGAFLDGYFLANRTNSKQINFSPINDGSNGGTYIWDQTDFFLKESYPDNVRAIVTNNEQVYLFGTETGEVWKTSAATTAFERVSAFKYGTISSWSPIVLDGKVYFLGSNSQGQIVAYVMDGFTPVRISTHAVESSMNDGSAPTAAYSYTYIEEGHSFWVFHVGSQCWGYDATTGTWHQRNAWSGSAFTNYPTYYHTFIAEFGVGKHITGGPLDGKLYESSVNFYDDAGSDIKAQRAMPYNYQNGGNRIYFNRMTLEMQTGAVASGAEPVVSRDYSDDRGNTWSTAVTAGLGVHNDYSKRVFWPLAGSSRDRVWRLSITGQSKIAMIDLDCEVVAGVN